MGIICQNGKNLWVFGTQTPQSTYNCQKLNTIKKKRNMEISVYLPTTEADPKEHGNFHVPPKNWAVQKEHGNFHVPRDKLKLF